MKRNGKLVVAVCTALALLMLAGCSFLDTILNPSNEVEGGPDAVDTRFVDGSAYHGDGKDTHTDPDGSETDTASTDDPYRDLTESERQDLMKVYNLVVQPSGLVRIGGWGTPGAALRETDPDAFAKAFDALSEAGFNCIVTSDEWKSPEALAAALSAARNHKMKLWYNCGGQSGAYTVGKLKELLKSKDSDVFDATVITIPGKSGGLTAADNTEFLQSIDELRTGLGSDKLKMTVRLFPSYGEFLGSELLNMTYTEYVQSYMKDHGMNYAVFGYDAFLADGTDRIPGFLANLQTVRRYGCPMYPILQCAGDGNLREPTLEELRLSVHLSLAMGASGYFFDGVCGNADLGNTGILDTKGQRTALYNKVKTVNAEVLGMRELYMNYTFRQVTALNYDAAAEQLGTQATTYFGILTDATEARNGPVIIGNFLDAKGRSAFYVVNADTTANASVTLTVNERSLLAVWGSSCCEYVDRSNSVTIELKPGEGKLVTAYSLTSPI